MSKPFDLEKALAGEPIEFDYYSSGNKWYKAFITEGKENFLVEWEFDGSLESFITSTKSIEWLSAHLRMVSKEVTKWGLVLQDACKITYISYLLFDSKELAEEYAKKSFENNAIHKVLKIFPITYEE